MIDTEDSIQALDDALESIFNENLRAVSKENTDKQLQNLDERVHFLIENLEQNSNRLKKLLLEDLILYLSDEVELESYLSQIIEIKRNLYELEQASSKNNNEINYKIDNILIDTLNKIIDNLDKILKVNQELQQDLTQSFDKLAALNTVSESKILATLNNQVNHLGILAEERDIEFKKASESRHTQLLEQNMLHKQEIISEYAQNAESFIKSNEANNLAINTLIKEQFEILSLKADRNSKLITYLSASIIFLILITLVLGYLVVTL